MSEIWKQIPEHNNYEASNMGRIRNLQRQNILKPKLRKDKYYFIVRLDYQECRVQHLVLNAFVGPKQEGQVCRHLNGISTDNRLENLKWGTQQENVDDAFAHGTLAGRILDSEVLEVRALYKTGLYSKNALADRYRVSNKLIGQIISGARRYKAQ